MQTPKDYAEELVLEMYNAQDNGLRWMPDAINCAKVAVNRILKALPSSAKFTFRVKCKLSIFEFYTEVLTELNKM